MQFINFNLKSNEFDYREFNDIKNFIKYKWNVDYQIYLIVTCTILW